MSEMIKQLQSIECPFGILEKKYPELAEELKKEKYAKFIEIANCMGTWELVNPTWIRSSTYRLASDYKEPAGEYKVFEVEPTENGRCYGCMTPIGLQPWDCLPRIKGFAGVQFEGQSSELWYMQLNKYINEQGSVYNEAMESIKNGKFKPAVPVRALFWVEGE